MAFFLRDIISFFVDFEHAITKVAPPGVMTDTPRDVMKVLALFEGYSNCKFTVFGLDFSDGLPRPDNGGGENANYRPDHVKCLILNFGKHAEIYINTMKTAGGKDLVNYCNRCFLIIKEAYHLILRDEFVRKGLGHPDTAGPEELKTLIEAMVYLPFSILDLDDPKYPEYERVEHAAELLALLTLYPLERIARDRDEFRSRLSAITFEDGAIMMANTFVYADTYKVPQRYVDLAFRWSRFDELYNLYHEFRAPYSLNPVGRKSR